MSNMIDNIYKKASFDETAKYIQAVMETTGRDMIKAMNFSNALLKDRKLNRRTSRIPLNREYFYLNADKLI